MLDRDAHSGGRHSLRKIPDKNIFVPCPCTFRLRRLARNARRKFGLLLLCGLYMCKFPRTIALVTCTLHFNFAGSHTMGSKALRGNTFCKLPASVVPTICPGKISTAQVCRKHADLCRGLGARHFSYKFLV